MDISEITFFLCGCRGLHEVCDLCSVCYYSELPLKRVLRVRKANGTLCSMALVSTVEINSTTTVPTGITICTEKKYDQINNYVPTIIRHA